MDKRYFEGGGCFAAVAGKKASDTGYVLVAHNEDNAGPLTMAHHYVEAGDHLEGELLLFEEGSAKIPQVAKTFGYFWAETLRAHPGESFADSFVNDQGVSVVSNTCCRSREEAPELTDGGIGYGLRRIVAERASSAEHAVRIAAALIEKYGYRASGRSYVFADKDEAWFFQIVNGKNYAAKRLSEEHIAVNANHYSIRKIDVSDKKNYRCSKTLISHAIENGWYTPQTSGDYSDFDFALAYQHPDYYRAPMNVARHTYGLKIAAGYAVSPEETLPFSVKAPKKVTADILKKVLSSHCKWDDEVVSDRSPHAEESGIRYDGNAGQQYTAICNSSARESLVIAFGSSPEKTCIWSAQGNSCISAFVPYLIAAGNVPDLYEWERPQDAYQKHFKAVANDLSYSDKRLYWLYQDLRTAHELLYTRVGASLRTFKQEQEKQMGEMLNQCLKEMGETFSVEASRIFNVRVAEEYAAACRKLIEDLISGPIVIADHKIDLASEEQEISVLLKKTSKFDVSSLEIETLRFGASSASLSLWAKATTATPNQEGLLVVFKDNHWVREASVCLSDFWVGGQSEEGEFYAGRGIGALCHTADLIQ